MSIPNSPVCTAVPRSVASRTALGGRLPARLVGAAGDDLERDNGEIVLPGKRNEDNFPFVGPFAFNESLLFVVGKAGRWWRGVAFSGVRLQRKPPPPHTPLREYELADFAPQAHVRGLVVVEFDA